jgi:thiamine phosphate synthase YjbQ (UPF0047 family)
MWSTVIEVTTGRNEAVHDITPRCAAFLREVRAGDGLLQVFIPHATAGIALIELGAGSDDDLLAALRDLLPAFIPPYATIPVIGGAMALGTWQSVALIDLNVDNPNREVRLSFLADFG